MQIKRIALGGIIMTVIMFSGCSTTVQNLAIGEEKTLETGKTEQESVTEKDINMNEKESFNAEAKAVITEEFKDITNNDMHILEAIGIEEPKSMSRIAGELHVTVGTLTTNMNSLEKKGYLERNRSTQDKRVVLVTLTEKGRKAFFHHRDFHRKMIHTIIRDLDEEEMQTLIKCLGKLDTFFRDGNAE